jgi:hypothetical protein
MKTGIDVINNAIAQKKAALAATVAEPQVQQVPLTNEARSKRACYVAGTSALEPFFVELLNRMDAVEADNVRLHSRCADLELAEATRQTRRKTA